MKQHRLIVKLAIVIALTISQSLLLTVAANTWTSQTVDPHGIGGKVIIDSGNNPHIFYFYETGGDVNEETKNVYYADKTGQTWKTQPLTYTEGNIFIMDTNNEPHIISTNSGGVKDTRVVDWNLNRLGISEVADANMVLDSSGNLHEVSAKSTYSNGSYTSTLWYTVWTNSGATLQKVYEEISNSSMGGLNPVGLSIDGQGKAHIVYVEKTELLGYSASQPGKGYPYETSNVKYAAQSNSGWVTQTAAYNMTTRGNPLSNFVLDAYGQPHFCYIHENFTYLSGDGSYSSKFTVDYTHWNGVSWVNQVIDEAGIVDYEQPNLRLDGNGNPEVYFIKEMYQPKNRSMVFAHWIGLSWDKQYIGTIPTGSYGVTDVSNIAFDMQGNPHFTYDTALGTYRSALRFGNLTYVSWESPQTPLNQTLMAASALVLVFVVAVVLIVYRFKLRRRY